MTELARVYGESLYELAREEGLEELILGHLDVMLGVLRDAPEYVKLLSTPSLPKETRRAELDRAVGGRLHVYAVSFMKILIDRDAFPSLPQCTEAYRARFYEGRGIMPVTAVTAVPMDKATVEKLVKRLELVFGKTVLLDCRVDPRVLGGMRLECAGKRFDGTVRDRLDRIEKGLRDTVL